MPVTTQLRVRYAETDQMGIVYYANYLVWFEIGRVELLRSLGLAYSELETDHRLILPVVDAHCRYRAPARYDDEILIETWPSLVRESVVRFDYRIYRSSNQKGKERKLLAEGETAHVVCDAKLERQPLPAKYAAALKALMKPEARMKKESAKPARKSQGKTTASAKPS
jgi:acyl-CoA thioester hydrolase